MSGITLKYISASSMGENLKAFGAHAAAIKQFSSPEITPNLVDCAFYRFAQFDANTVNTYSGEFMAQYSETEFIVGYPEELYRHQQ